MNAQRWSLAFSMALAVAPILAYADGHAHSSGGSGHSSGGSSGGSAHSGGGHPSSGSHAVPRTHGSGGSGAQYRHPQAGTGTGYRYGGSGHGYYGHGYGHGHGYYGHGYYPYYGYGYGYGYPYWGWGAGLYYYGGYPYYSYDDGYYSGGGSSYSDGPSYPRPAGDVRVIVDPDDANVYVDGAHAGVVDDFDGFSQPLHLPAGRHEILLRRDGYRSQRFKVYVTPDNTVKIHFTMEKGTGDAPQEVVVGDPSAEQYARHDQPRPDERRRYDEADRPADSQQLRSEAPRGGVGPLRLSVNPDDASVYVDGRFYGTAREASRLHLTPGEHRIEVVRPGYRTYDHEIKVGGDAPTNLDVTLER
jgi:hypothetical protein